MNGPIDCIFSKYIKCIHMQYLWAMETLHCGSETHDFLKRKSGFLGGRIRGVLVGLCSASMDIPASNSLPSSLALIKSSASLGIPGSGSFQSHLSTGKSYQRLRIGVHSSSSKELSLNQASNASNASSPPLTRHTTRAVGHLHADAAAETYLSRLISWPETWFQWVAFVYCCLSFIVLSATIVERFLHRGGFFPAHSQGRFVSLANSGCKIDLDSH